MLYEVITPVYDLPQALENPYFLERGGVQVFDHPDKPGFKLVASPFRLGEPLPANPAPKLGEHTEARAYAGLARAQYRAWSCFNWTAWAKLEDEAVNFARKAIALDDSDHHAHCILGTVYLFLREFALARKHLERAVTLNPNDANSSYNFV